jgi:pyruvate/2-oxoglutarate dehydrogenase complex dihydrolipoamide dehydrogenase (E3) component
MADSDRVVRWSFEENDRAQAERETDGFIKVVVGRRGRVKGATIVGARAGEFITPWIMAMQQRMKIGAIASLIAPYPTMSEVSKRVAGSYLTDTLFGDRSSVCYSDCLSSPI